MVYKQEFENAVKSIVWALRRVSHLIYKDSREIAKKYGITAPQGFVVKSLYKGGEPLSSADLSRQLDVTPPNITGIIDRLEEKGIVMRKRADNDRRTVLIELCQKGKELGKTLPDVVELKLVNGLKDLSPIEIYGIYAALQSIVEIVGTDMPSDESVLSF